MNDFQAVSLDILKEFSRVAASENIEWCVMFGTLLGAVRSNGFIPWDTDIDVALPRSSYEKLKKLTHLFKEPYFLQTIDNDPAAALRIMKLRRSDTAFISVFPDSMTIGGNMGIYMDIIPLDEVPDAKTARSLQHTTQLIRRQMLASAGLDECRGDVPPFKEEICFADGGVAGLYPLFAQRHEDMLLRHMGERYYAMPVLSGERGSRVYQKEWFSDTVMMQFEDIEVPVPSGYREVLVASFPEGLYEAKPEKDMKENRIIDSKRSYKEYVSIYADMLAGISGKKVYLFGAGDSLRIWMERYGKYVNVVCTFDNAEEKWGTTAYGVTVRNPDELPNIITKEDRLIITSIYHKEISKQLRDLGISDFYIFIDGYYYSFEGR